MSSCTRVHQAHRHSYTRKHSPAGMAALLARTTHLHVYFTLPTVTGGDVLVWWTLAPQNSPASHVQKHYQTPCTSRVTCRGHSFTRWWLLVSLTQALNRQQKAIKLTAENCPGSKATLGKSELLLEGLKCLCLGLGEKGGHGVSPGACGHRAVSIIKNDERAGAGE